MIKKTAYSSTGAIILCFGLAIIFILEELLLPVNTLNAEFYHTTITDYRLLSILVNLPLIMVWFVAFWGYTRLKSYVRALGKAKEAKGYRLLTKGMAWLACVLPVTAIIDRLLSGLSDNHPKAHDTTLIISNYFNLLLPFVAFIIIFVAAKVLLKSQKPAVREAQSPVLMAVFLLFGALYCYLILKTADLTSLTSSSNIYTLPVWLIIVSLIIPYLYSWFIGLLASYDLLLLSRNIPGVLYKRALAYLTSGLIAIILSFITIQYLTALWPLKQHLVFNYQLVIITLFRIIGGFGFILLAVGANKLKRIEEV